MPTPHSATLEAEAGNENTSPQRLVELAGISPELARRVAQNPNAPSELLQKLSQHSDRFTRQNVTANPNTPIEILLELAASFPEVFLENPILPLLQLEKPDFLQTLSTDTAIRLLQCEKAPKEWFKQVSIDVRQKVVIATALSG
jgi:hypothetical protein